MLILPHGFCEHMQRPKNGLSDLAWMQTWPQQIPLIPNNEVYLREGKTNYQKENWKVRICPILMSTAQEREGILEEHRKKVYQEFGLESVDTQCRECRAVEINSLMISCSSSQIRRGSWSQRVKRCQKIRKNWVW